MNIRIVTATMASLVVVASVIGIRSQAIAQPLDERAVDAASNAITINSVVPNELNPQNGGAPRATMSQAAYFAWQEFIALNWPAVKQNGGLNQRDTPDTNCRFGDPRCAGPRVW